MHAEEKELFSRKKNKPFLKINKEVTYVKPGLFTP